MDNDPCCDGRVEDDGANGVIETPCERGLSFSDVDEAGIKVEETMMYVSSVTDNNGIDERTESAEDDEEEEEEAGMCNCDVDVAISDVMFNA